MADPMEDIIHARMFFDNKKTPLQWRRAKRKQRVPKLINAHFETFQRFLYKCFCAGAVCVLIFYPILFYINEVCTQNIFAKVQ